MVGFPSEVETWLGRHVENYLLKTTCWKLPDAAFLLKHSRHLSALNVAQPLSKPLNRSSQPNVNMGSAASSATWLPMFYNVGLDLKMLG